MAQSNVSRRGVFGHLLGAVATAAIVPATIPSPEDAQIAELSDLFWKLDPEKRPHLIGLLRSLT